MKHDENGFVGNNWKSNNTRVNQLNYYNESDNSGLSDISYELIERVQNYLKVKL
jgi:hypothetical protein